MKKQNLIVIGMIVALIAAVAVAAAIMPQSRTISKDAPSLLPAETPESAVQASEATAHPSAKAYLVVSVGGDLYEPIPLLDEGSFTVKQSEETSNTIHMTPDSIWMEHSSCDNQDCVLQGTVSLENMGSRVLTNMIICLPNEVVLELHTPETLQSVFGLQQ